MSSVSRRLAAATLALALTAVPATAVVAGPADVEDAASSWTAAVLAQVSDWLDDLGLGESPRRTVVATAPSTAELSPREEPMRPWLDPNGETVDSVSRPGSGMRPWLDPNG